MLNCHRLNSWNCHKRITSNTFAKDCFHLSRTKVMGLKTIRHCRSRCGSNFSGLVACFVGLFNLHFLAVACAKMDLLDSTQTTTGPVEKSVFWEVWEEYGHKSET